MRANLVFAICFLQAFAVEKIYHSTGVNLLASLAQTFQMGILTNFEPGVFVFLKK